MNDTQREERDRQDNMRFVARAMLMERKVIGQCGTHEDSVFLLSESEDGDDEAEAIEEAVKLFLAHDRTMSEFNDVDEVWQAFESVLVDTGGVTSCVLCSGGMLTLTEHLDAGSIMFYGKDNKRTVTLRVGASKVELAEGAAKTFWNYVEGCFGTTLRKQIKELQEQNEALRDVIGQSRPLAWVASGDADAAHKWEREATAVVAASMPRKP